jgi:hypothetical protein
MATQVKSKRSALLLAAVAAVAVAGAMHVTRCEPGEEAAVPSGSAAAVSVWVHGEGGGALQSATVRAGTIAQTTDGAGFARLSGLSPGLTTVVVEAEGYEVVALEEALEGGGDAVLEVQLTALGALPAEALEPPRQPMPVRTAPEWIPDPDPLQLEVERKVSDLLPGKPMPPDPSPEPAMGMAPGVTSAEPGGLVPEPEPVRVEARDIRARQDIEPYERPRYEWPVVEDPPTGGPMPPDPSPEP